VPQWFNYGKTIFKIQTLKFRERIVEMEKPQYFSLSVKIKILINRNNDKNTKTKSSTHILGDNYTPNKINCSRGGDENVRKAFGDRPILCV